MWRKVMVFPKAFSNWVENRTASNLSTQIFRYFDWLILRNQYKSSWNFDDINWSNRIYLNFFHDNWPTTPREWPELWIFVNIHFLPVFHALLRFYGKQNFFKTGWSSVCHTIFFRDSCMYIQSATKDSMQCKQAVLYIYMLRLLVNSKHFVILNVLFCSLFDT